mmetsp:Transcript_48657/g.75966  ORF Transcript_48657/g.75966 Transcript_48657/m.75966 type:complete len:330 (+) Transcript_48657:194-1183(+)
MLMADPVVKSRHNFDVLSTGSFFENEVCVCLDDCSKLQVKGGMMTSALGSIECLHKNTTVQLSSVNMSGLLWTPSSTVPHILKKDVLGTLSPQILEDDQHRLEEDMKEISEILDMPDRIPKSDEERIIKFLHQLAQRHPQFSSIVEDLQTPRDPRLSWDWVVDRLGVRDVFNQSYSPETSQEVPMRLLLLEQAILASSGQNSSIPEYSHHMRREDLRQDLQKFPGFSELEHQMHTSTREIEKYYASFPELRRRLSVLDRDSTLGETAKREPLHQLQPQAKRAPDLRQVPASAHIAKQPGLPPGWQMKRSSTTGKMYYLHSSGRTQWHPP